MLTHGSLFTGIGGFDLGFKRAGIKTIWQVEIEDYCQRVLAKHFPGAKRYDDVRTVGKRNLEPVDVISGGFPCQDISNAGKRAGIDGQRSGLWSEYARIICELRPRYVVVENVAALLGRGMERVLGDLAEIGYDAEWQSIRASDLGAPHRRERIWLVAYPNGCRYVRDDCDASAEGRQVRDDAQRYAGAGREPSRILAHTDSAGSSPKWNGISRRPDDTVSAPGGKMADADRRGFSVQRESSGSGRFAARSGEVMAHTNGRQVFGTAIAWQERNPWAVEPDVGRVAHGIPARVDRLRGLGNAVVPQIAEWIGRRIVDCEARHGAGENK